MPLPANSRYMDSSRHIIPNARPFNLLRDSLVEKPSNARRNSTRKLAEGLNLPHAANLGVQDGDVRPGRLKVKRVGGTRRDS